MTSPKEESEPHALLREEQEYELSLESGKTLGVYLRKRDFAMVLTESRFSVRYTLCLFRIRSESEPRWIAIERVLNRDGSLPRRRGRGRARKADSLRVEATGEE